MKPVRFFLAATTAVLAQALAAQQSPPPEKPPDPPVQKPAPTPAPAASVEEEITVTATRSERAVDETPATVTVREDRDLSLNLVSTLPELVSDLPGVSTRQDRSRYGVSGFNIRGIEGNRVLMQIDGVRVPDLFEGGPVRIGRDLVDPAMLKRVEILRGPSSSLYGSDALGGVVSYVTRDPADLLSGTTRPWAAALSAGYDGATRSFSESVGFSRIGGAEALLLYTRRDGEELRSHSGGGVNPQDYRQDGLLVKLVFPRSEGGAWSLTFDGLNRSVDTDVRDSTGPVPGPPGSRVESVLADDSARRWRVSLGQEAVPAATPLLDSFSWHLSYQDARTEEGFLEHRFSGPTELERVGDGLFSQKLWALDAQASRELGDRTRHRFTYGLAGNLTDTTRRRDRTQYNLTNGTSTKTISGETFPNKNFPDTETWRVGLFAQDEITLGGGASVIPGVRLDWYRMDPKPDAEFEQTNPSGFQVRSFEEWALSPHLGALVPLTAGVSVWGQYARGFRSPPYDAALTAFTNPVFAYDILPNPDLRPETSDSFEVGLRFGGGAAGLGITAFHNRYHDFIDTEFLGVSESGRQQFRFANIGEARIQGLEAEGRFDLRALSSALEAFRASASIAWAKGDDRESDVPLNSVDPLRAAIRLSWRPASGPFGASVSAAFASRKSRVAELSPGVEPFRTPSHTVVDATGEARLSSNVTLRGGVFNLFDEKYWVWSDVRSFVQDYAAADFNTQPGRHARLSVDVRF